jgi:hypothetical protein
MADGGVCEGRRAGGAYRRLRYGQAKHGCFRSRSNRRQCLFLQLGGEHRASSAMGSVQATDLWMPRLTPWTEGWRWIRAEIRVLSPVGELVDTGVEGVVNAR